MGDFKTEAQNLDFVVGVQVSKSDCVEGTLQLVQVYDCQCCTSRALKRYVSLNPSDEENWDAAFAAVVCLWRSSCCYYTASQPQGMVCIKKTDNKHTL